MSAFAEKLAERVGERQSQIVLGVDPDPMALWPSARQPTGDSSEQRAARAVREHCLKLIHAAAPACVAVKLQLACFERLGAPGWDLAKNVIEVAHEHGLLAIADGKRGDIDVSARAYAEALLGQTQTPFGPLGGLNADMVTVNPLMGVDAIEPFVKLARQVGAGVLVLVRTSNPGASDIEDLKLEDGSRVWEQAAAIVDRLGAEGIGQSGLSDIGAVVGATVPEHLQRARELMPRAIFLLPGVGAQGGKIEDLAHAFLPGRAGGLITASRGIADAYKASGGDPASAAHSEAERLRAQAWALK